MESAAPAVNQTRCQIRHVRWWWPVLACDRCGQAAPAVAEASRTALDIALESPVMLLVTVSVHHCPSCRHSFRAQPPFLRPDAIYTNRVVTTAVRSVYEDGMAVRRVAARLARDFWVQPSEGMIRQWCKAYCAGRDFASDYQAWVVSEFSGVLCVDEVYQDRLALLLAVDPAAPDGDRLVGDQLVHQASVGHADVVHFLERLRQAGVAPDQIITDGSPLYPSTIAAVWPRAAHQLCLFHQTRQVTKVVRQALRTVRKALPPLPPGLRADRDGISLPASTPAADAPPTGPTRGRGRCRREVRQAGIALIHALRQQGHSIQGIARQTGISRPTVRSWLREPVPAEDAAASEGADPTRRLALVVSPPPPPAPWESWAQVQQVRQAVGADRFRLLCRPEHLTADDQAAFALLFASPVGASVQLARSFLEDWYAIWRDDAGQRRSLADAQERFERWQTDPAYATMAPLRKVQRLAADQFGPLSHFLRQPRWEATNNGAERTGRLFRHQQAPHFTLRTPATIEDALKAHAWLRKEQAIGNETVPNRCTRGRKAQRAVERVAA